MRCARRIVVALLNHGVGAQGSGFRVLVLVLVLVLGSVFGAANQNQNPSVRVGLARPGGGYVASDVPLEIYVARVLAGEAARARPPAALEALAITIRTFARANRGRHRADGFDLCDQTHCQVLRESTPSTERAAQATAGQLLVRDGVPASVYYSASC